MTDYIYNETIYILEDGNAITGKVAERYFTRFLTDYVGKLGNPTLVKMEHDFDSECFHLYTERDADSCGECDDAGVTEGRCPHEHYDSVGYKTKDLYSE